MHTHTDTHAAESMSAPHPNDTAEALKWAVQQAEERAKKCDYVRLMHLPALKHLRDKAVREARGA